LSKKSVDINNPFWWCPLSFFNARKIIVLEEESLVEKFRFSTLKYEGKLWGARRGFLQKRRWWRRWGTSVR
jgi:hypothetical protein